MTGKIIGNAISLMILVYIVMLIIFYFMHLGIISEISDINYNVTETVSLSGELSQDLYDYLELSSNRYGDFKIKLRYDKFIDSGNYDTYYKENNIIDIPMEIGDKITIYVYSEKKDLFETLLSIALFNKKSYYNETSSIRSIKSVIITKDGE